MLSSCHCDGGYFDLFVSSCRLLICGSQYSHGFGDLGCRLRKRTFVVAADQAENVILHVLGLSLQLQPEIMHLHFPFLWAFRTDLMLRTCLVLDLHTIARHCTAHQAAALGSTGCLEGLHGSGGKIRVPRPTFQHLRGASGKWHSGNIKFRIWDLSQ